MECINCHNDCNITEFQQQTLECRHTICQACLFAEDFKMQCSGCAAARTADYLAPDIHRNLDELQRRMRTVKSARFKCRRHTLPVQTRHPTRHLYQCRLCEQPNDSVHQTVSHLKQEVWQLNSTLEELKDSIEDMSWLIAQINSDSLDSLHVADIMSLLQSKKLHLKEVLGTCKAPGLPNVHNLEGQTIPVRNYNEENEEYSWDDTSNEKCDSELHNSDQDEMARDISAELIKAYCTQSGTLVSSTPDTPPKFSNESEAPGDKPSHSSHLQTDYIQQSLNNKLTAHNKKLLAKTDHKYYLEIKNIKYKPLQFQFIQEIAQVPNKFHQVSLVKDNNSGNTRILLFDQSDFQLCNSEPTLPQLVDFETLVKEYQGMKLGFNQEQVYKDIENDDSENTITCVAFSNKSCSVVVGWSDGLINKQNLDQLLLNSYSSDCVVRFLTFNDNDSVILVAQYKKIVVLHSETLEFLRDFKMTDEVYSMDTAHGQLQVGLESSFQIIKQSNPIVRIVFDQDCKVHWVRAKGEQAVIQNGTDNIDILHHQNSLWKIVHRLEFKSPILNIDYLGDLLVVLLDHTDSRYVMMFKMTYV